MTTPSGRREALAIFTQRGLSQRKACSHLGLSRRVAGFQLVQPDKEMITGEQLLMASQTVRASATAGWRPGCV